MSIRGDATSPISPVPSKSSTTRETVENNSVRRVIHGPDLNSPPPPPTDDQRQHQDQYTQQRATQNIEIAIPQDYSLPSASTPDSPPKAGSSGAYDLYPVAGPSSSVVVTANDPTSTTSSTQPLYSCKICGKQFSVQARLTRHHRTHTGEKPFQCEICKKQFGVKENLNVHRRIHTNERPYKCRVCNRAFEHSGKLHRHQRIHTGERPHKCNRCNKTFIQSGQLVIHMRTHTGEKPYVCASCNKGFTCSKQLKVHTRIHTGEKPYTCDTCGKSFGYNHVLKLHQFSHYGVKIYKCTLCTETFSSKKEMESHIKSSHSASDSSANSQRAADLNSGASTSTSTSTISETITSPVEVASTSGASSSVTSAVSTSLYTPPPTFQQPINVNDGNDDPEVDNSQPLSSSPFPAVREDYSTPLSIAPSSTRPVDQQRRHQPADMIEMPAAKLLATPHRPNFSDNPEQREVTPVNPPPDLKPFVESSGPSTSSQFATEPIDLTRNKADDKNLPIRKRKTNYDQTTRNDSNNKTDDEDASNVRLNSVIQYAKGTDIS